jgi:hypothetical protein
VLLHWLISAPLFNAKLKLSRLYAANLWYKYFVLHVNKSVLNWTKMCQLHCKNPIAENNIERVLENEFSEAFPNAKLL